MEEKKGFRAISKHILISPTKLRRVANQVRNKPYVEAIAVLESLPQKGAKFLRKTIQSAAANALYQNKQLDEEMLYVKELQVNEGPRLRRVWPRSRGRRDLLLKRMSHIAVVVDEIARMGE